MYECLKLSTTDMDQSDRSNYDEWFGQSDKNDELPDGTYYVVKEITEANQVGFILIEKTNKQHKMINFKQMKNYISNCVCTNYMFVDEVLQQDPHYKYMYNMSV
jgi:hypothetical protein